MRKKWQAGSVMKRGAKWYGRFRVDQIDFAGGHDRRQKMVVLGSTAELRTKAAAKAALRKLIEGTEGSPQVVVQFGDLIKRWREVVLIQRKYSTRRGYESLLRVYIEPAFAAKRIDEVDAMAMQGLIAGMIERGRGPETCKRVLDLLSGIFRVAEKWGMVQKNPAKSVELPQRYRKPQAAVTPAAAARLIAELDEPYSTLVAVFAITAMRCSEVFGLRWSALDFERQGLWVREAIVDRHWDVPKGRNSIRFMGLPASLLARLKALHERSGRPPLDAPVFANGAGRPMNPSNVLNRQIWPAYDRLGMPRMSFHAFRRGTTSRHILHGVDPKTAQAILGHQDVQTTLTHYALADAGRTRSVVETWGEELLAAASKLQALPASELGKTDVVVINCDQPKGPAVAQPGEYNENAALSDRAPVAQKDRAAVS